MYRTVSLGIKAAKLAPSQLATIVQCDLFTLMHIFFQPTTHIYFSYLKYILLLLYHFYSSSITDAERLLATVYCCIALLLKVEQLPPVCLLVLLLAPLSQRQH